MFNISLEKIKSVHIILALLGVVVVGVLSILIFPPFFLFGKNNSITLREYDRGIPWSKVTKLSGLYSKYSGPEGTVVVFKNEWTIGSDVDLDSFQAFEGSEYAKDKNVAYYRGRVIPDSSPASFVNFFTHCGEFAKDDTHIYYGTAAVVDADPGTFTSVDVEALSDNDCFFKDKDYVFFRKNGVSDSFGLGQIVSIGADPSTFRFITSTSRSPFVGFPSYDVHFIFADKDHVFFDDNIIEKADPTTYTILNQCYAKDKNYVYSSRAILIPGADSATFEILSNDGGFGCSAKDANFVYVDSRPVVPNRDNPQLISRTYGKTTKGVYYLGSIISGADPSSFEIFEERLGNHSYYTPALYSTDKQYIYFKDQRVVGADKLTFRLTEGLGAYHAIDKNAKYLDGVKIKDDFKLCSTDPKLLPGAQIDWGTKLGVDFQNTSTLKFEFCRTPDNNTLVGYEEGDVGMKTMKLFDSTHNPVGDFKLDCTNGGTYGPFVEIPVQSMQKLEGSVVTFSCIFHDACSSYTVNEFDLSQLKVSPSGLSSKEVRGTIDCGYRG